MRVLIINARYHGGGAERCGRELFERLPQHGVTTDLWLCQHDPQAPHAVRQLPLKVSGLIEAGKRSARRIQHRLRPHPVVNHCEDAAAPDLAKAAASTRHPTAADVSETVESPPPGLRERIMPTLSDLRHVGFRRQVGRLRSSDFDVVHLHAGYPWCASIRTLHALCQRVPVVWTLHDDWAATGGILHDLSETSTADDIRQLVGDSCGGPGAAAYHRRFQKAGDRWFLEQWMPQPTTLVAPSAHLTHKARESGRFPHSEVFQIPNGVSLLEEPGTTLDRTAARSELGLATNRPVVLMIAAEPRVVHKGFRLGAAALSGLNAAREQRLQVLLLGHNGERLRPLFPDCELKTLCAHSNAELATAYRAADLTVIPSLTENFPYVALESLACRTPIVGFRVGGLPEIVDEHRGGLLAEPFAVQELTRHCARLLGSPHERRERAEAGHKWLADHCDMTRYLQRVHAVYDDTIRRFHGRHSATLGPPGSRRAA